MLITKRFDIINQPEITEILVIDKRTNTRYRIKKDAFDELVEKLVKPENMVAKL